MFKNIFKLKHRPRLDKHAHCDWVHSSFHAHKHKGLQRLWCMLTKRYHVRYKFNKKHIIFDAILLFGIAGLVMLNIYVGVLIDTIVLDKTTVQFNADFENVISGKEMAIPFIIENKNNESLVNISVELSLPPYAQLKGVNTGGVYDSVDNVIVINQIPSYTEYEVVAQVVFIGEVNTKESLQAIISYDREGVKHPFGTKFRTIENINVSYSDSVFSADVQGTSVVQENASLYFTLKNDEQGLGDFNVLIKPTLPDDIKLIDVKYHEDEQITLLESDDNGNYSINEKLTKGHSFEMVLDIPSLDKDIFNEIIGLNIFIKQGDTILLQKFLEQEVQFMKPQVTASLRLKNTQGINVGSDVFVDIFIKNNGNTPIQISELVIHSDSQYLVQNDGKDVWTLLEQSDEAGYTIEPGQERIIPANAKVHKTFSPSAIIDLSKQIPLSVVGDITYTIKDQSFDNTITIQTEKDFHINSQLTLLSFARYYTDEGEQLGRGPLPPLVGESTKYWVFWRIDNTTHSVKDVTVNGVLPYHVEFTGRYTTHEGNEITFDPKTRKLTWTINEVKEFAGSDTLPVGVGFEVEVIPEYIHLGGYVPLVTNIVATGTDIFTQGKVNYNAFSVTTHLLNDDKGSKESGKAERW